jgi:hypothetical protein
MLSDLNKHNSNIEKRGCLVFYVFQYFYRCIYCITDLSQEYRRSDISMTYGLYSIAAIVESINGTCVLPAF